jgi:hypothetical protein
MPPRPVTPIGQTPSIKSLPKFPRPAPPGFFAPPPQPIGRQGPTVIPLGGRRKDKTRRRRYNKRTKTKHRRYKQ